jgi:Zn-dependent protease with chaperone function
MALHCTSLLVIFVAFKLAIVASTSAEKVRFRHLLPADFQHSLDRQLTSRLRNPLVEMAVRGLANPLEQAYVSENLASAVQVGERQMPRLHASLIQAAHILDMDVPELYVRQNPIPNAYTLAIQGRKPFIVLHSSIIELLTDEELQAVIAHELGHLKCEHGIFVTLLNLLAILSDSVIFRGGLPLRSLLLEWQRAAEYSCDRAALLVTQDANIVASVFLKLAGGSSSEALCVESFIEQAESLQQSSRTVAGKVVGLGRSQVSTHPVPVLRAKEIIAWQKGRMYTGLINRALPLRK